MHESLRLTILRELGVNEHGLNDGEVQKLCAEYGFNEISERREPLWKLVLSQFNDTMVFILFGAVAVSLLVPILQSGEVHQGELTNAVVILAIIVINAFLGFFQEWRAENAIAMLQKLSAPLVKVRRGGRTVQIPARELVPGDLMLVEAGDRVSADARVVAASSAECDESSLTGESVPVAKSALPSVKREFHFSPGMLYSATLITRGSAEAVVVATGLRTEIGKITSMVMKLKSPPTPLQLELARTGQRIGILVLLLCTAVFVVGLAKGMEPVELFFTAVSLAVAAVPEGLPAIVTVCLAIGVQRMIKRHALVRKLDAVETLGNITVICADKTGTMTENRMRVTEVWTLPGVDIKTLAEAACSCNRAELPDIGDPTELALLQYAESLGVERLLISDEEVPFTSEAKYMVTVHERAGGNVRFTKGATEVLTRFVPSAAQALLDRSAAYSKEGLRVLAVLSDDGTGPKALGLLAMMDPPRKGVKEAIETARRAGIRTLMITGDHPATALSVAESVGIVSGRAVTGAELEGMDTNELLGVLKTVSVFARVQPVHKVKILEAFQGAGEIVAMSGDGVNDAPALKRAHVGVGMGLKGTDVAREASAIVLTDDDYSTIVAAVAEGRRIYDNIKKFVIFLMRSNLGEVLTITFAMFLGLPLPLLPLHILWINLVTDSFPAIALAAEPAEQGIMSRPPRSHRDGIFSGEWTLLIVAGILNAVLCLGVFVLALRAFPGDIALARSGALTVSIVFQLFLAFSTRSRRPAFLVSPFGNPLLILGVLTSLLLHAILLATPLSVIFSVKMIPFMLWEEVFGGAFVAFIIFECMKLLRSGNLTVACQPKMPRGVLNRMAEPRGRE